jgi:hypothetical protein
LSNTIPIEDARASGEGNRLDVIPENNNQINNNLNSNNQINNIINNNNNVGSAA